jgi:hypothetical protein
LFLTLKVDQSSSLADQHRAALQLVEHFSLLCPQAHINV